MAIAGSVTAGSSQSVTVTAKDQYGNTTSGYTGTVKFTSTDPAAGLPANADVHRGSTPACVRSPAWC